MTEPITVSVVIPAELKALLEKWAQQDDRSVSYVIRQLIVQEAQRRAQTQPSQRHASNQMTH